jgi:fumarate reductase subunit D
MLLHRDRSVVAGPPAVVWRLTMNRVVVSSAVSASCGLLVLIAVPVGFITGEYHSFTFLRAFITASCAVMLILGVARIRDWHSREHSRQHP